VLVAHGDTLSILQAVFLGTPLTQHRQYGLATAELKALNADAAAAGGGGGGAWAAQQDGQQARALAAG
jgi:hypothetical protein